MAWVLRDRSKTDRSFWVSTDHNDGTLTGEAFTRHGADPLIVERVAVESVGFWVSGDISTMDLMEVL